MSIVPLLEKSTLIQSVQQHRGQRGDRSREFGPFSAESVSDKPFEAGPFQPLLVDADLHQGRVEVLKVTSAVNTGDNTEAFTFGLAYGHSEGEEGVTRHGQVGEDPPTSTG